MTRRCASARWHAAALRKLRGQAATEYLVVLMLLVALLALPVDGNASALDLWRQSLRDAYAKFLFALSGLV